MTTINRLTNTDTRLWVRSLIIILISETMAIVGFTSSMPIIPFYIQVKFGITNPDQVKIWNGLLNAVPTLMLAIFAPIWGTLADSKGRRAMLLRALLGGSLSIGAMFFAQNVYQLFVLRIIQGATTGSIAAANVLLLSLVPFQHAAISLAILQIGIYIGTALGPLFGGWIFDTIGGQANFLISATLIFTGATLVWLFIKEPPLSISSEKKTQKLRLIPDFSVLKQNPSISFLITTMFLSQLVIALVNTQLALFIEELNGSHVGIGSITGIVFAGGAVTASLGAFFFGWLSKRASLQMCFIISLSAAAIGYLLQAMSPNCQFLFIIKMIDGFFIGGIMPVFNAVLNTLAPEKQRGAVFGLSSSVSFMGSALGPFIGSTIAVTFGVLGNRSIFMVGTLILSAILMVALKKKDYWEDLNREVAEKIHASQKQTKQTTEHHLLTDSDPDD